MKLLSMRTQNFMKCEFAEVNFSGSDVVEICGKNGSGKSSFAKSIWALFGGKGAIPKEPVTEGKEQSILHAELDGDFVLTRTIEPSGETKLELRNKEGGKYRSPQEILDGFNLRFGFWPEEFIREKQPEQAIILRKVVGLDFTREDMKAASLLQERLSIGREHKQLAGQLAGARFHKDAPEAESSAASVLEKIKAAQALEREKSQAASVASAERNQAELKEREIERLKERIAQLEADVASHKSRAEGFQERADAIELPDTDALEAELSGLEASNAKVRDNSEHRRIEAAAEAKKAEYDRLSSEIQALADKKAQALAEAKFPVPGLGFDESGVTYNGKPFAQASKAQQWEIAVSIGFALNPQLKLVYIEDGSLLDADTLERVEALVKEHGGQLLLETVGDSSEAVVMFADGVAHFRNAETGEWSPQKESHEEGAAVPGLREEAAN